MSISVLCRGVGVLAVASRRRVRWSGVKKGAVIVNKLGLLLRERRGDVHVILMYGQKSAGERCGARRGLAAPRGEKARLRGQGTATLSARDILYVKKKKGENIEREG